MQLSLSSILLCFLKLIDSDTGGARKVVNKLENEIPNYTESLQLNMILGMEVKKLREQGVDIEDDNYHTSPQFLRLRDSYIYGLGMATDWAIEKYVVGQKRLEKIYGCYDLRIERELTAKEAKESNWYRDLADRYPRLCRDEKAIRQYFKRSQKGLIARLKDIGIDLNAFDGQSAKIRLLYFLYCFQTDHKIEWIPFLKNPTLENVDNSLVNEHTQNGKLMAELKHAISRGISNDFTKSAKNCIFNITSRWEQMIFKVSYLSEPIHNHSSLPKLELIDSWMESIIKKISLNGGMSGTYRHSLLETVYLKLVQHESLGLENDIIDIADAVRNHCAGQENSHPERYLTALKRSVHVDKWSDFCKEKRDELVSLVFDKEDISASEYHQFDSALRYFPSYLEMLQKNTAIRMFRHIPELLMVVFVQELLELDAKEFVKNRFYRYQSSDQRTLKAEIKHGQNAFTKNQLAWILRISWRLNHVIGYTRENQLMRSIETKLDFIIRKVLMCNSILDMQYVDNFFQMIFDAVSADDEKIRTERRRFISKLPKGYSIGGNPYAIDFLFGILINSSVTGALAQEVAKEAENAECEFQTKPYITGYERRIIYPIEMTDNYVGGSENYSIYLTIKPLDKQICIAQVGIAPEGEYLESLKANGIIL